MADPTPKPRPTPRREEKGPPCKRCRSRVWYVEERDKARLRWLLETLFAAPDVWIFQGESAGWPSRRYQRWTCAGCGRSVKV